MCTYDDVVVPRLVSPHAVAPDELDGPVLTSRVEAVVVGHDLLPLRVRKHLVAAESVAEGEANLLATLSAHRVEAVVSRVVLNLRRQFKHNNSFGW